MGWPRPDVLIQGQLAHAYVESTGLVQRGVFEPVTVHNAADHIGRVIVPRQLVQHLGSRIPGFIRQIWCGISLNSQEDEITRMRTITILNASEILPGTKKPPLNFRV